MSRAQALTMLKNHRPFDPEEARHRVLTMAALQTYPLIYLREFSTPGHICSSAIVSNMDDTRVLLNGHALDGVFMNFGGHADGDENLFHVSQKELFEESGITNFECSGVLFDIDVHYVRPHIRKGEQVPEHVHFDFSWHYRVPDDVQWTLSDESTDIRWFDLPEAMQIQNDMTDKDGQLLRLYRKIAALRG